MKARIFFFISIIFLLGLAAVSQTTTTPSPSFAITSFAMQGPDLHLADNAALPGGKEFAQPLDITQESSSRRDQPFVLSRDANGEPCIPQQSSWFSIRLKITTAPAGRKNCPLDAGGKFRLFAKVAASPYTLATAGALAGWSQWQNHDPEWGQGADAYGQRFAASYADNVAKAFFNKFAYPVIFRQDPRYFRKGQNATTGQRLGHAVGNTFVGNTDSGHHMPNLSLWAGTASTVALENLYHPGNDRGFNPAAKRFGESIGVSMGFDVLREFWPDISRKLHLQKNPAPVGISEK
ncbi:MAG: hypothetical protein LAO76_09365 [Acidobacteriia bacterium]|nr:hypothetical protein [Terriglobia bacterium]